MIASSVLKVSDASLTRALPPCPCSVAPLTWNGTLEAVSLDYAEACHWGHSAKTNRSGFGKLAGENILMTKVESGVCAARPGVTCLFDSGF